MNLTPTETSDIHLEQLLNRSDIWRGDSRTFVPQLTVDSGYADLNTSLLNNGWPTRSLVEVCQRGFHQQEWLLLAPVLKTGTGYVVLLNPPALPFCQALIQLGIDLDRIIIVQVANKADFLASFVELARSESCELLLVWQQHLLLSYTELRKCLLSTNEGTGLYILFRPESAQQQSSPASLRLLTEITAAQIQIKIFKQKGVLQQHTKPIALPLPKVWKGFLPYHLLDQTVVPGHSGISPANRKSTNIVPMRRGKR
ncbi:MAG: diguanylate cyclase [Sphingobacteriales bacterium]|nr:MAG: diguanylate cyclase [Sphingobacteriales bacterium]